MSLNNRIRGCPPDGDLRALIDGEGDPRVRGHVDICPRCRVRMQQLSDATAEVSRAVGTLQSMTTPVDTAIAYRRFSATVAREARRDATGGDWVKEQWSRPRVRAFTALATVVALMLVVSLSPMRTVANDFLNQFRVQKFAAITIPVNLEHPSDTAIFQMMMAGDQNQIRDGLSGLGSFDTTFKLDKDHMPAQLTLDEAAAKYDGMKAPTSVPGGFDAAPQAYVTDAGSASVTLNVDRVKQIIGQLNLPIYAFDTVTSPNLAFNVDVPSAAIIRYQDAAGANLIVGQMESPQLDIPAEFNMDQLREDVLRFPFMPTDLVTQLRAVKDWKETLIIPIPEGATSENVTVDGNAGLLIKSDQGNGVLWQSGGKLYGVFGQVSADQVLRTAKSLSSVH